MLTIYQQNHLLPAYGHHGPRLYPVMIEASRAHVVMLAEEGLIGEVRASELLRGLETLRSGPMILPEYDGGFEDVYFALERTVAEAAGIPRHELDLQLARSRNDLDAGVFRMILREEVAAVLEQLLATVDAVLDAAERGSASVIVGYTHRRPAQPTTIGHVLAGYAEALLGQAALYRSVLAELNLSPLGACALAGTDLPISPPRLAELLGFDGVVPNAYSSVVGADHLGAVASANARSLATGARVARVLQDWMSWGWIETPAEFCQGSSIMPQKRNPVVLEHMVSMAGMAIADATSVLGNISAAWWEDSNNATTDVQLRLWESDDRALRFFRLTARLFEVLAVRELPSIERMVLDGTTTTAAADALSLHGVPFRAAHGVLSVLVGLGDPAGWTADDVRRVAAERGLVLEAPAIEALLEAARRPEQVLERAQADGPGTQAVLQQITRFRDELADERRSLQRHRAQVSAAAAALDAAVTARTT